MTFRAKPVVKRSHKPSWESQDRRNLYLNIGFGVVVVAAVAILLIAAGLSWYNDHLAPVGSVNGRNITTDEFKDRYAIETRRLEEAERRVHTAAVSGQLTEAQKQTQLQAIETQRQSLAGHHARAHHRPGPAGRPGQGRGRDRHGCRHRRPARHRSHHRRVAPRLGHRGRPGGHRRRRRADDRPGRRGQGQGRRRRSRTSRPARRGRTSPRPSPPTRTRPQAGDLGWIQADDTQEDEAYLKAVFAAEANTPTAVIEGEDGTFRIGRVTEIAPETVDPDYQSKLQADGIDMAKYRAVVAGDVTRQKLEEKIVADATKPAPQRRVAEIYIARLGRGGEGRRDQDPPHPLLAQGRRAGRGGPARHGSRVGGGQGRGRRHLRQAEGGHRPVRLGSPGPRATRPAPRVRPGPAASCPTSTRTARSTRRSRRPSSRTA